MESSANFVVELEDISKTYKLGRTSVHALKSVSLKVREKSFTVIVGPSGSGKTTILDIIGCISSPTGGRVKIDGKDVASQSDRALSAFRAANVGFVFQTFNLIDVLTAFENVEYPLVLLRTPKKERHTRVAAVLEQVGLKDFGHHRPAELSGGQRQRVAVARALVTRPRFVLADEPTANLDSATGTAILDLMAELHRSLETTFILATHDQAVMKRATETVKMHDGQVVLG